MKTKLKAFFIIVTALVVLSSCLIVPDDPSEPTTEKFEYTAKFSGPTYDEGEIVSYQFMCYVNNRTGQTLENVKFEIDWYDQVGNLIMYDSVTIPRLEKGGRWPVGVMHNSVSDLTRLKNSDASIRYLSSSSDLNRYTTNLQVNGQVDTTTNPSYAHGTARNYNSFDVIDPQVYIVTETSSGNMIAEYGMVEDDGIMTRNGGSYMFGKSLNLRAKTPSTGRYYFFAVGTRREAL